MKIGLIEVSHWHSGMYINALLDLGENIVAISDRNEIIAKKIAKELKCRYYTDYRKMLERESLDFVFSFGRHVDMPSIIGTLIDYGVPFNTEKPCGIDYKVVERLAEKAHEKALFTSVSFVKRVSVKVGEILEFLSKMGDIKYMYFKYITGPPSRYVEWKCPWMLEKRYAGGGSLINLGVHYIDLVHYLTGESAEVEYSLILNEIYELSIEEYALVVLKTAKTHSIVEVAYTPCHKPEEYFSITGTSGRVILLGKELIKCLGKKREVVDIREDEYFKFVEKTIGRFRRGDKPIATLKDAARVLKVVNDAYSKSKAKLSTSV